MNFRLSIGSVVWFCLLSAVQQQVCDAWAPLNLPSSSSIGQKRKLTTTRTPERAASSLVVLSLVEGDPVEVSMAISNTYVLIGGVVGSLSIAGFAFTKLTSPDSRPQAEKDVDAYYQLAQARKVSQRVKDVPKAEEKSLSNTNLQEQEASTVTSSSSNTW